MSAAISILLFGTGKPSYRRGFMSTDTTPVCPRLKGLGQEGQVTPMTPLGWDCIKYYSNIHDILIKYFGISPMSLKALNSWTAW